MTYYKYAERDATSQVNWADVSKKWTDEINQVATARDKKRADIQTATDELTDSIINAPMGENEGVNAWYSNFADQSSEYLLDANRRLKSGDLKVRDYNTIMANMTQGTERMTGLAKDFSDNYTIKMERLQNDQSQQAEVAMMELAEGYANFTNTQGIVNPTNGMISIAKNGTGETVTIPQMRAYINMQYDRYDVGAALDEQVARLAADKKVIMSGDVKTRESQLRAWNLAKDNLLDAELADGLHVSSLLTEDVGGYNVVTDATKVGENDVLFVLDPSQPSAGYRVPLYGLDLSNRTEADLDMIFSADLNDAQRSALIKQAEEQKVTARDWLNTDFERRLGVVETPMAERTKGPTSEEIKQQKGAQRTVDVVNNIRKLHSLKPDESEEDVNAALSYIQQLNPNVQKIDLRDEEIVIRMKGGDLIPIPKGDKADLFVESIINAVYKDKAVDLPSALNKAGVYDEGLTRHTLGAIAGLDETVGYDDEIQVGIEGVLKKSSPRAQYELRTSTVGQDDEGQDAVAAAATDALARMNFSGVDVEIIEAIDRPGWQWTDTKQNLIKYYIPDVMPYQVFIPDTNAAGIVGQLIEMADIARSENREITVEELKSRLGPENYKNYNTQEMRDAYPTASGDVVNPDEDTPDEDTPEEDPLGIL